jgi:hypothetical protein
MRWKEGGKFCYTRVSARPAARTWTPDRLTFLPCFREVLGSTVLTEILSDSLQPNSGTVLSIWPPPSPSISFPIHPLSSSGRK